MGVPAANGIQATVDRAIHCPSVAVSRDRREAVYGKRSVKHASLVLRVHMNVRRRRVWLLLRSPADKLRLHRRWRANDSYLVDPASSHMLVSKIKPCMSKHKPLHGEAANGSLGHP